MQGHRIFTEYHKKNRDKILEEDMSEVDLEELLDKLEKIERLNAQQVGPIRKEVQLTLEAYRHSKTKALILG